MEARIQIEGGDQVGEFAALAQWLETERALHGVVRPVRRDPADGQLGGAFDALAVALGSSGAGVALARSLTVWLQNRRSDVKLTITAQGRTVELDARRIADVPALLREVLPADES